MLSRVVLDLCSSRYPGSVGEFAGFSLENVVVQHEVLLSFGDMHVDSYLGLSTKVHASEYLVEAACYFGVWAQDQSCMVV